MIHCEELMDSPKITWGESPSLVQTVAVFSTTPKKDRFDQFRAYQYASSWFRRNGPGTILKLRSISSTLRLRSITCESVNVGDEFQFTATYNNWRAKTVKYSMDTSGETARICFGQVISAAGKDGKKPINYGGGIAYNNGQFDGVDMPVPGATFSVEACYPYEFYTEHYERILINYRGCVNSSQEGIYAPGELMFLGAQVAKEEEPSLVDGSAEFFWRIRFNFKGSPTMQNLTNNGTLDPIVKLGHDVYWIDTITAVDTETNRMTRTPIGHYTVRPYTCQMVDFAALQVPEYRSQLGPQTPYIPTL